jgi:hypothetical protein
MRKRMLYVPAVYVHAAVRWRDPATVRFSVIGVGDGGIASCRDYDGIVRIPKVFTAKMLLEAMRLLCLAMKGPRGR